MRSVPPPPHAHLGRPDDRVLLGALHPPARAHDEDGGERVVAGVDARVADRAAKQHGVVDLADLAAAGMSRDQRRWRLAHGRLHPVEGCPGVLAVGHTAVPPIGRLLAAVKACGEDAHAGDAHATWVHGLLPPWIDPPGLPATVLVPAARGRRPEAARPVRRTLLPEERTVVDAVPVTTVERTLCDCAISHGLWALERLLDRAIVQEQTTIEALEQQLVRYAGRRGAGKLRALLVAERRYGGLTRSELEDAFIALLRQARLTWLPRVNWRVGAFDRVDALVPRHRVAVELDGTRWHRTRRRQEDDRAKEMRLRARGLRVVRYTARQVFEEPMAVLTDLLRVLAGRAG